MKSQQYFREIEKKNNFFAIDFYADIWYNARHKRKRIKEVLPYAIAFGETIGGAAERHEIGKDKFLELLNKD